MLSEFRMENSAKITDLKVFYPPIFEDHRGIYVRTYSLEDYKIFDAKGNSVDFVEDDYSRSKKGVLRGLHGDFKTWKLIQNLIGEIFFVVVDMRKDSPTHLAVETFTLGDSNQVQVLIPAGCANGYYCVSDTCIFAYKQSKAYSGAENQFTVAWNDPKLKIPWPSAKPILSQRDRTARFLED